MINSYRKAHGLKADGVVDLEMRRLMDQELAELELHSYSVED
jgi:hypothetical protein